MANQRNQLVKVWMRLAHSRLYVVTSNLKALSALGVGMGSESSKYQHSCLEPRS